LDITRIVADLKQERERISRAIAALEGSALTLDEKKVSDIARDATQSEGDKPGGITAEGRRRLSLAMKKRWAARKKKGA
jgi:hypothetical protein